MAIVILGISAFYHDSAAAILIDGEIIAAAQEERFTRIKNDASFPINSIAYVLQEAGIDYKDLSAVAFYDKPFLKFERLLETYHAFAPRGIVSFLKALPVWMKEKLLIKKQISKHIKKFSGNNKIPILFPEHHLSHAASAYYPSPFNKAAILTIDGVGEWATTTISYAEDNRIKILKELHFPHSVGLLYSAFTYFLGFKVNSGEYKVMGLAPYGDVSSPQTKDFIQKIKDVLIDIREDGSVLLNMQYFDFASGLKMINEKKWEKLFELNKREAESAMPQSYKNLALAIQEVLNEIVVKLAQTAFQLTNCENLVMAGGVALNCVSNSKVLKEKIFSKIWIQPAAGDAGGALGAAYAAYHISFEKPKKLYDDIDGMKGAFLGPSYANREVEKAIRKYNANYAYFENFNELTEVISKHIHNGKLIGWFQGRMEFGPRALGNRSILANATDPQMQSIINQKIKKRESFRPFAPSVLEEDVELYFKGLKCSPYMLFVAQSNSGINTPAVIHVDGTARIQTVNKNMHPKFHALISAYKKLSGSGMVVNTSFNQRGEPLVCTPADAYEAFVRMGLDFLVINNYIFDYTLQPLQRLKGIQTQNLMPD